MAESPRPRMRRLVMIGSVLAVIVIGVSFLDGERMLTAIRGALAHRSDQARVALFRWGEIVSLEAAVETRCVETREIDSGRDDDGRFLAIVFGSNRDTRVAIDADRALDVATFAPASTEKDRQFDILEVRFEGGPAPGSTTPMAAHRFDRAALAELREKTEPERGR